MSTLPRLTPLAACLAAALALPTPCVTAADVHVTNCSDSNAGSLRTAIAGAANGDNIVFDVGTMNCSTIALTSGRLDVHQDDLSLTGPASIVLSIDAGHNSQVLLHFGAGTISVKNLKIVNGSSNASGTNALAQGGCLAGGGSLRLVNSVVTNCSVLATGTHSEAEGGAVITQDLYMYNSVISDSTVSAEYSVDGGGAFLFGSADIRFSSITNNSVLGASTRKAGGGLLVAGPTVNIVSSSISGNTADVGGGVFASDYNDPQTTNIIDSTISGNTANNAFGGLDLYAGPLSTQTISIVNSTISGNTAKIGGGGALGGTSNSLINSTVAFNTATSATFTNNYGMTYDIAAGLETGNLALQNSIIANNMVIGGAEWDLDMDAGSTVSGSHNLIMSTIPTSEPAPADSLTADPVLAALANHGGATLTHAPLVGSPAIDAGTNCFSGLPNTDQRGSGYPRTWGIEPDIGAYEYGDPVSGDVIFRSVFDGLACTP